jgi:hypothetical protein
MLEQRIEFEARLRGIRIGYAAPATKKLTRNRTKIAIIDMGRTNWEGGIFGKGQDICGLSRSLHRLPGRIRLLLSIRRLQASLPELSMDRSCSLETTSR